MENTRSEKKLYILLGVSIAVIILGILFLVNAMGIASFFKSYAAKENALAKYIVVILTMSIGIMLFSNVSLAFESEKLRKGLTIGITVFAFVLTLPLVYVFVSLLPFTAKFDFAEVDAAIKTASTANPNSLGDATAASADALGLNAVDKLMGVHTIYWGFVDWFGEGGFLWVVLGFMLVVSVVFLFEPLAAGICVCRGKILNIAGKKDGKFRILFASELPVITKRKQREKDASYI
jgi:hypothetical protein